MSRITFFIGNGFDLNVGLETRYQDFYKYYLAKQPNDYLAKNIKSEGIELWADLEIALGEHTSQITSDKEDKFLDSKELLEESLAEYLETQMSRILIDDKKIISNMKKTLLGFQNELPKGWQEDINGIINNIATNITFSFISFNYTNVFDLCLETVKEEIKKNQNVLGEHRTLSNSYSYFIGNILHIHGTTTNELILGVNDVEQISNQKFVENELNKQLMIKEEANKRLGQNKIKDAYTIIDNSFVICIYGMSIGATDKFWWAYLCQWLNVSDNRKLIIFDKLNNQNKRVTVKTIFKNENRVLENLKNNSNVDNETWEKIKSNIYVKFDADIFNFKLVSD